MGNKVADASEYDIVDNLGQVTPYEDYVDSDFPAETLGSLGSDSSESSQPRTVFPPDGRVYVKDTTKYPYSAVVRIYGTFPSGAPSVGTGCIIGRDTVLTAGHIIYNKRSGGWVRMDNLRIVPGLNGSYEPFGSHKARTLGTTSGWANSDNSYANGHDVGLIRLTSNIGDRTGKLGLSSSLSNGNPITLTAYGGGQSMMTQNGYPDNVANQHIFHKLDMTDGASGAPIYNNSRQVVGVQSGHDREINMAARLNGEKYSLAYTWANGKDPSPSKVNGVNYNSHVMTNGWLGYKANGATGGTTGQAKRMEALRVVLQGYSGGIQYRAHVQTKGWLGWVGNDKIAGTTGEKRRMEAVQIKLTGAVANTHHIEYRAHVRNKGWLGWVRNGSTAGTTGQSLQMEAVQIRLVKK